MSKAETIRRITGIGVLPVIRADSRDEARQAVEAVAAGGITNVEITMTVPDAVELIEDLCGAFKDEILVGAGTVLDAGRARQCVDAGAKFIVSPALDFATIEFCRTAGIAVMPGALTPSEIVAAWNAGADFVKIFPAGALGGAGYLKSLKAPLPHIKMIPTGGVSLQTAAGFIKAGAEAVGVGADLVDLNALREGRAGSITENARQYLKIVREARGI